MQRGYAFRNRRTHNWCVHILFREENNEPCSRHDLHYKMCFVTIEGMAEGGEPVCRRVSTSTVNNLQREGLHLLQCLLWVAGQEKKEREKKEKEKIVLCSCLQQQCLPVCPLFFHLPGTVYNSDTNQFKEDLFWVSFIPLLAFVPLHSQWLGLCQ